MIILDARDLGDEHVDTAPSPVAVDALTQFLLDNPDSAKHVSEHVMQMIGIAEAYRHCCRACEIEANDEDGS